MEKSNINDIKNKGGLKTMLIVGWCFIIVPLVIVLVVGIKQNVFSDNSDDLGISSSSSYTQPQSSTLSSKQNLPPRESYIHTQTEKPSTLSDAHSQAYDEGYSEGYDQGEYDSSHGYASEDGFDDTNTYSGHDAEMYKEGYQDGYEEGYQIGKVRNHDDPKDEEEDDD